MVFLGIYQNSLVTEAAGPSGNLLDPAADPSTILHIRFLYLKMECFPIKNKNKTKQKAKSKKKNTKTYHQNKLTTTERLKKL